MSITSSFRNFRRVFTTIFENWFIIVHIGNKYDHDGGTGVNRIFAIQTTRSVINGGYIQFIFVAFQLYRLRMQTNYTGDLFDNKLPRGRAATDKPESTN